MQPAWQPREKVAVKIKPYTMAVNNVGDREAVTTASRCDLVRIRELPSISPKQLFKVSDVPSGGSVFEVSASDYFDFPAGGRGHFDKDETVGYVESATGATTFQRLEYLIEP